MSTATLDGLTVVLPPAQAKLRAQMLNPWKWRLFAVGKLPSLALWRVRITALDADACTITIPYGYRTQNPFRSTYFAAQAGAAELSTGALAMLQLAGQPAASMLVTRFDSRYYKKVSETLTLVCEDGPAIAEAIAQTIADGKGRETVAYSRGYLPDGQLASEFWVTWSFKRR